MTVRTPPGTIHGVGLGPGSADLMSVRADRLVRGARHLAYFRKAGRRGRARTMVDGMVRPDVIEFAMDYPVTTEIAVSDPAYNQQLATFYADCTRYLIERAQGGEDVVVLCEGDPFFYGSFMHLHARIEGRVRVRIVPGITGMSAAWTATGVPITWGDDVLTVAMATMPEDELVRRIADTDALVVMKIGRHLEKLRRAVARAGKTDAAWLIEYAAMDGEHVTKLSEATETAPYFSILLIHGHGRRP
jgi:precorrin-2/cobalt-factor-2 C20-methyltransferase